MNCFLRRLSLCLFVVSGSALGVMPHCGNAIACDADQIDGVTCALQFRALAMRPHANNLEYAAQAIPIPVPSPTWQIFEVQPDYHFAFDVRAYAFMPSRDTAFRFNWMHYKHSDNACHQVPSTNDMVGPFFEIGPDALPYKKTTGEVSFRFDTANAVYGQYLAIGAAAQAYLFTGVSYAHIQQRSFSTFSNEDATVVRTICVPTSFKGAGPEFGMDTYYHLCYDFYLVNRTVLALLLGKIKNCTTFQAYAPELPDLGITPPNTQYITTQSNVHVVPNIDLQLGVAYACELGDVCQVQLEAGYQALIYSNPLQSIQMGSEVITPPVLPDTVGVFARTFRKTVSNFGLAGPYASIAVVF